MYKIFAFLFFTSITVAVLYAFSGKDLPIGPFVVLNALLYLFFILYVFIKSFFKAKYSFQNIGLVKNISVKIHDKEPLTSFLSATVVLIYIMLVSLSVFFIFFLFVFPIFKDVAKDTFTSDKENSSDLYSMRNDISSIKYHIKDLKLKQYFNENLAEYTDEDSDYTYTLTLDQNRFFDWERNDSYYYSLQVKSKVSGLVTAGWQSGGIELHQSPAASLKTSVAGIDADYRNVPGFFNKPVFVVVVDDAQKTFYVVYPKAADYEDDYTSLVNLDYIEGMIVSYQDYEFLENGEIRLFLDKPLNGSSSVLVDFIIDSSGQVLPQIKLERD